MAQSAEVQELVATLEQQYDAMAADASQQVPSADEIGAEFERFLAERDEERRVRSPDGSAPCRHEPVSSSTGLRSVPGVVSIGPSSSTCWTSRRSRSVCSAARQPKTALQRVFGGQVLAQALVAASRTVPRRPAAALDARLLHPPGPDRPADRVRRGEHPRRPLVLGPPGRGPAGRLGDLLRVVARSTRPRRASSTTTPSRPTCRPRRTARRSARCCRRPPAGRRRCGSRSGVRWRSATSATRGHRTGRWSTRRTPPGPASGSGRRGRWRTTRGSTRARSPTPAT